VLDPIEFLPVVKTNNEDVVIVTPLEAKGEPHICSGTSSVENCDAVVGKR
jgi:hypothetical protein